MRRVPIGLWVATCCLLPSWLGYCPTARDGATACSAYALELDRAPQPDDENLLPADDSMVYVEDSPDSTAGKDTMSTEVASPPRESAAPRASITCAAKGFVGRVRGAVGSCVEHCLGQGGGAEGQIEETDHIHARFVPVPTRPVFWPREPLPPPIPGGPFPLPPRGPDAAVSASPQPADNRPAARELRAPEPPAEGTPSTPSPPPDREVELPRRLGMTTKSGNWMFPQPEPSGSWRAVANQVRRGAEGGQAIH